MIIGSALVEVDGCGGWSVNGQALE